MTMTLSQILDTLSALALLVPVPAVQLGIPALITVAREVERSGLLDTAVVVELDTIGAEHRAAVAALVAELQRQIALTKQIHEA